MIEIDNENKKFDSRGQAIVEFSIALPVLLLILFGLFEVGRLMFTLTAVENSSRNAVRYASAFGLGDDGLTKYNNCAKIKEIAETSAFVTPITSVVIRYDDGVNYLPGDSNCDVWTVGSVDPNIKVSSGDRVTITVTAQYRTAVKLIPIPSRTITSTSSRTILGIVDVD